MSLPKASWCWLVLGVGGLASCSLTLNLDDLTGGETATTAGGAGGTGGAGATGGAAGGDAGSGGAPDPNYCESVTQCDPPGELCVHALCVGNRCGTEYTQNNPAAQQFQTAGDCVQLFCADEGSTVATPDYADAPNDDNECTTDACGPEGPTSTPLGVGAACTQNGGRVCTGTSDTPSCVACNVPDDCIDDAIGACRQRGCSAAGDCTPVIAEEGTAVSNDSPNDCQRKECDDQGNVRAVADDTEVPDDGNECTVDECVGGEPDHGTPEDDDHGCGTGQMHCDGAGHCIGCADASSCGEVTTCRSWSCDGGTCNPVNATPGTLLPDQDPEDCVQAQCTGGGNVEIVNRDDEVPPDDGNDCTDELCADGLPFHPNLPLGAVCPEGVCDGEGSCVECNSPTDCPAPALCHTATCVAGVCGEELVPEGTPAPLEQQTPRDCKLRVCDASGQLVDEADPADLPIDEYECTLDQCNGMVPTHQNAPAGSPCTGGYCDGSVNCVACLNDTHCLPTQWCEATSKTCKEDYLQGIACQRASQCKSTYCIDGFCCQSSCGGECHACSAALTGMPNGTCSAVLWGTDPDEDCVPPEICGGGICCDPGPRTSALPVPRDSYAPPHIYCMEP